MYMLGGWKLITFLGVYGVNESIDFIITLVAMEGHRGQRPRRKSLFSPLGVKICTSEALIDEMRWIILGIKRPSLPAGVFAIFNDHWNVLLSIVDIDIWHFEVWPTRRCFWRDWKCGLTNEILTTESALDSTVNRYWADVKMTLGSMCNWQYSVV